MSRTYKRAAKTVDRLARKRRAAANHDRNQKRDRVMRREMEVAR
jgi:hypothetical protein